MHLNSQLAAVKLKEPAREPARAIHVSSFCAPEVLNLNVSSDPDFIVLPIIMWSNMSFLFKGSL